VAGSGPPVALAARLGVPRAPTGPVDVVNWLHDLLHGDEQSFVESERDAERFDGTRVYLRAIDLTQDSIDCVASHQARNEEIYGDGRPGCQQVEGGSPRHCFHSVTSSDLCRAATSTVHRTLGVGRHEQCSPSLLPVMSRAGQSWRTRTWWSRRRLCGRGIRPHASTRGLARDAQRGREID